MLTKTRQCRGQVTLEVAVLFVVVVAALVAMAIYLQRGVQGGVKSNADSLGTQFSISNTWNSVITSNTEENNTAIETKQNANFNQSVN